MKIFINHETNKNVEMSDAEYGSHLNHCCIKHGCKYGDENCPVVLGRDKQIYSCEECDEEYLDKHVFKDTSKIHKNKIINEDMLEAIKVQFLKQIFEDHFPERGMKAWLTAIDKCESERCWKLFFDFTEFEDENDKYLKPNYYDDNSNPTLTAKEVGSYSNKYSVYFGDFDIEEYGTFTEQISEYLKII